MDYFTALYFEQELGLEPVGTADKMLNECRNERYQALTEAVIIATHLLNVLTYQYEVLKLNMEEDQ